MDDIEKIGDINWRSSIELTASLMEQLEKAFEELKAHKVASIDKVQWNDVKKHFLHLESMVKKKLEELEVKAKVFAERESHNRTLLDEREATVMAKEQDMLDKVQELKDAAVDAIEEARKNYNPESLELANGGDTCGNKVSSSFDYDNAINAPEGKFLQKMGENAEGTRAELTQFCEQMDSKGLVKFLTVNQKKLSDVCKELLSVVLGSATSPASFVLDAIEGFFPLKETSECGDNGDAAILGMRRSCLILMEALSAFLTKADTTAVNFLTNENKHRAMSIANEWKPKLARESTDTANGNSLEVEGFLRLLATFRISPEFSEEELCKYVLAVAHHRQATELCHSLQLTHKIPGLVDTLIRSGRQIDAVHFIHAFQLSDTYPTVPLLRGYLRELRRNSQGTGNANLQNDNNARELAALRVVIECVEHYKLEAAYPLEPLHRRVGQLDKSGKGSDKKRTTEAVNQPEPKKTRPSGGFSGPRPRGDYTGGRQGPLPFSERDRALVGRYSSAIPVPSAYSYQAASQPPYVPSSITSSEGPYYYAQDSRPRDLYPPAPAPASVPPSYGAYTQASPAPPSYGAYTQSSSAPPSYGAYTQSPRFPYM